MSTVESSGSDGESKAPDAETPESAEPAESPPDLVVGPFVVLGDADADACGPGGCCSN